MNNIIYLSFLAIFPCCVSGHDWAQEKAVRDEILTGYEASLRPTSPLKVECQLVALSLNGLDIADQTMSISGTFYMLWFDHRLAWDPANHNNIDTIMLPYGTIWLPSAIVENSANEITNVGYGSRVLQRVYSDGMVKWMPPVYLQITCEMKILRFPFDTQKCSVMLYLWAHNISEMFIEHNHAVNTSFLNENGEWDLIGTETSISNITDAPETLQKLNISFSFKRKWLFLGLAMITPAILNSLLMCAVFALSFDSGEKLGYALTVLLTYMVLLTLVADSLPPISTDISALQIYLTFVMCFGTIATLLTVWTVSVYNLEPNKPKPPYVLALCRYLLLPLTCHSSCWKRFRDRKARVHPGFFTSKKEFPNGESREDRKTIQKKVSLGIEENETGKSLDKPPAYSGDTSASFEQDDIDVDKLTWVEIAELMDAVFLRLSVLFIGTATLALVIFFAVTY